MKKSISVLLSVLLLLAAVTSLPFTAYAADTDSDSAGAPDFAEVRIGDAAKLKTYLQANGNYKIFLTADIEDRIGTKGEINDPYLKYWCVIGSGVKVLDMQGHNVNVYNDSKVEQSRTTGCFMFNVPDNAEIVINDTEGDGELHYDGMLKMNTINSDIRTIFNITGGKLTVNGGRIIAGRRKSATSSYYHEIYGDGINLRDGEVVINGGRIEGRGYNAPLDGSFAAIKAYSGKVTINDGDLVGYGRADALKLNSNVEVTVKSGYFDVYKNDKQTVTGLVRTYDPEYGQIGIPGRAFNYDPALSRTKVWQKSVGEMTASDVTGGGLEKIHNRVLIEPKDTQVIAQYSYDGEIWNNITANTEIAWDKISHLKFRCFDSTYFSGIRSYDAAAHSHPNYKGVISRSPGGEALTDGLGNMTNDLNRYQWDEGSQEFTEAQVALDLYKYSGSTDAMKNNNIYYLQLTATEHYKGMHTYDRRVIPLNSIKIRITEPVTIPDIDVDFDWNVAPDNVFCLIPSGEASRNSLDELVASGTITSYSGKISYYNKNGSSSTYTYPQGDYGWWSTSNICQGESNLTLSVTLYKSGSASKTCTCSKYVVYPPTFTADKTVDNNDAIWFYPSDTNRKVTFTASGAYGSKINWTRNGTKITGATGLTYTVTDAAAATGWYSLVYSFNGKDYPSSTEIYVGIKDGTRYATLSQSGNNCVIRTDNDSSPTLTVITSGEGWSTISKYRWEVVSVSSGMFYTKYRTGTVNSITLADIFGKEGHMTDFLEGDYVIQCRVEDSIGNQRMTNPITIPVKRPVTDLKLNCNGDDVTDKFIAFSNIGDTAQIDVEFLPANAVSTEKTIFTGYDGTVCGVTDNGMIQTKKAGTTSIRVHNGYINRSVTVYVPKTSYNISISAEHLNAVTGEEIYQGEISVPDSAGFSAFLSWSASSNGVGNWYEVPEGAVFESETYYKPEVTVYPDKGVVYPTVREKGREIWNVVVENINITINGVTYYGAASCSHSYFTGAPISKGNKNSDFIILSLDPTEKLTDTRDEYLSEVDYEIELPVAGQTAHTFQGGNYMQLDGAVLTEGIIFGGDMLVEVTDTSTINDNNPGNDAVTEFSKGGTFEEGHTYRYGTYLNINSSYRNEAGGKLYYTGETRANCTGLRTITQTTYAPYGMLTAYVYFTVGEAEYTLGDVNEDERISVKDVTQIQRHISDIEPAHIWQAADINRDGFVTVEDATLLQRYLAEFDEELGTHS